MGSPGRSLGMCTGVMAWVPSGSASHFHFSSKLRPADRSFIPSWWLCLAVDLQFAKRLQFSSNNFLVCF